MSDRRRRFLYLLAGGALASLALLSFRRPRVIPEAEAPITLLDGSVHTDTLAGTVTVGDLIHGNATPLWARLGIGAPGRFLRAGASIPQYDAIEFTKGGPVLSPAAAINIIMWRAPFACTVTNVRGYRVGGTGATINARLNGVSNHLASALSLTSADTWMDGGAVQNTAYVAGDKLEIMLVTLAGSPTQVAVQVDYTRP